jgi:putative transposase
MPLDHQDKRKGQDMARTKQAWTSSTGCVYNIGYHLVWSTKYRKQVLTGEIESSLKGIFSDLSKQNGFQIQEMEVMPDHCHLFISCHPKVAPSNIVKILKGSSARKLFIQFPKIKKNLWGWHLWNPSYYIGTVGDMSKDVVLKYIQNQKSEE